MSRYYQLHTYVVNLHTTLSVCEYNVITWQIFSSFEVGFKMKQYRKCDLSSYNTHRVIRFAIYIRLG